MQNVFLPSAVPDSFSMPSSLCNKQESGYKILIQPLISSSCRMKFSPAKRTDKREQGLL